MGNSQDFDFDVALKSDGDSCDDCNYIARINYICAKCGYILKNGGLMAKEICPECRAFNSFIIAQ